MGSRTLRGGFKNEQILAEFSGNYKQFPKDIQYQRLCIWETLKYFENINHGKLRLQNSVVSAQIFDL